MKKKSIFLLILLSLVLITNGANLILTTPPAKCPYDIEFDLENYTNLKGGNWSCNTPKAISGSFFSPVKAGAGFHLVNYSVFDVSQNKWLSDTFSVKVYDTLHLNFAFYQILCDNYIPFDLNYYVWPSGGVWKSDSLKLSYGHILDPAKSGSGIFSLIYDYKQPSTLCSFKDTFWMEILPKPTVHAFTENNIKEFCSEAGLVKMKGTPAGGYWDGTGILYDSFFNTKICNENLKIYKVYYYYTDTITFCFDYDSVEISVYGSPEIKILPPVLHCYPQPYVIDSELKKCSSNKWSLNPQLASGSYGSDITKSSVVYYPAMADAVRGYFYANLNAFSSHCPSKSDSLKIALLPYPIVDFKGDTISGTTPHGVQFTDLTTIKSATLKKWEYLFGDNSYSDMEKNPYHIYTDTGTFNVNLKVTTSDGCVASLTKSKYIKISKQVSIPEVVEEESSLSISFESGIIYITSKIPVFKIQVFNALGKLIYEKNSFTSQIIQIPDLQYRGIGFVSVFSLDKQIYTRQIILK